MNWLKENRGFISIPIIIAIVVGILAAGTAGYVGVTIYTGSKDTSEDELIQRIEDLEKQLESTPTSTEEVIVEEEEDVTEAPSVPQSLSTPTTPPVQSSPPPAIQTPTVEAQPEDFRVNCVASYLGDNTSKFYSGDYIDVPQSTIVEFEVSILFESNKNYEIKWNRIPFYKEGFGDVRFRFSNPGDYPITPTVTRISDGYSKEVECPIVVVSCNKFDCFSLKEKQETILNNILAEIDSWYDNTEFPLLGPVNLCIIGESIVRAFEYAYELNGGTNAPGFSLEEDCATSVAPRAYQAKIELLKGAL